MKKDYKECKLYYNYKISLQWISTNYNYNENTTRMGQARGRLWNAGLASEIFWHPVMHVQKLQISLLMRITDFCPLPLHWGKRFTSWALSSEWLLWAVLKIQISLNSTRIRRRHEHTVGLQNWDNWSADYPTSEFNMWAHV